MEDQTQLTGDEVLYVLTDDQVAALADGAAQGAAASVSDDVAGAVARLLRLVFHRRPLVPVWDSSTSQSCTGASPGGCRSRRGPRIRTARR